MGQCPLKYTDKFWQKIYLLHTGETIKGANDLRMKWWAIFQRKLKSIEDQVGAAQTSFNFN